VATNSGETVIIPNSNLMQNRVIVLARRGDSATEISMERIATVLESAIDRVHILLKHLAPLAEGTKR